MSSNTWSVVKLVVDWDLRVVLCMEKQKNQIKNLPHNTGVSQISLINKYYYIFSIVSNISSYYLEYLIPVIPNVMQHYFFI